MHTAPLPLPGAPPPPAARHPHAATGSSAGFSLAEVLVGVVALALALGMAAAMNGVATRGVRSSTQLNDRNAAVDADIAAIRTLAERYTWCAGRGNVGPDSGTTCLATNPSDESYYSPAVSQDPSEAGDLNGIGNRQMGAFLQACADGTLNTTLLAAINATAAPAGITRRAQALLSDGDSTNRIELLYAPAQPNDPNPVFRSAVISPTVAAWCP